MTGLLLSKYEKTLRDVSVKVRFLDTEKEYIIGFLDNERMTAVNGEVVHEQMMQEANKNFKMDIAQIDNLYDLIMKETSNRATEKAYKELYNNTYLEEIEEKEKNFEKEITNVNISVGAVINSNYWRIEGIKNIYTVFREEISQKFDRDFSKYDDNPVKEGYQIEPISLDEDNIFKEIKQTEKEEEFDEEELSKYEREENGYSDDIDSMEKGKQLTFDEEDLIKYEEDDDEFVKLEEDEDDEFIKSEQYEENDYEEKQNSQLEKTNEKLINNKEDDYDEEEFDEDDEFGISGDYEYKRKMKEIELQKRMNREGANTPTNKRIIKKTKPSIKNNITKPKASTDENDIIAMRRRANAERAAREQQNSSIVNSKNKNSNTRKIKIKNMKPHIVTETNITEKRNTRTIRPKINNFDNNSNNNISNKKSLKIRKPSLSSEKKDVKIQNTIDQFMKNNDREEARKANAHFLNKIFKNNKDKDKVLKSS